LVGSLVGGWFVFPAATPWRVAFQAIGLAYNYRLIPWPGGRTRFKEMYFLKNFSSGVLFILSTMMVPLSLSGAHPPIAYLAVLIGFFLPLELTYEIAYDLRDVKGDLELKVPTFPVVHGVAASRQILRALLGLSAASLLAGAALGVIALKELVLIGGVVQQALYLELRLVKEPTSERCVFVTYLGAGQILSYLVWIAVGLPVSF
ncbi:MAG: UbiA family prenyltransferase, partial [Myxococcaceae bacterium]